MISGSVAMHDITYLEITCKGSTCETTFAIGFLKFIFENGL